MGQIIGYRRVSTSSQNFTRQELPKCHIVFEEYISGSSKERPELAKMMRHARAGDTVLVHSIDRLARSLQDLQNIVDELVENGVTVKFLKENLTFSQGEDNASGRLMLQVLGSIAEFERTLIKARQKEGVERAKREGKYLGRQVSIDYDYIKNVWEADRTQSMKTISDRVGCSRATVYNVLSKYEPYTSYKGKNLTPAERANLALGSAQGHNPGN
ncbi:recombinase family protein [Sulfitobacter sp. PM12]|uniref:recombinase family protein n=1 Tax=Sulfitobacter sp. PM12 TaxID=3138497 RepID=UPI00388E9C04